MNPDDVAPLEPNLQYRFRNAALLADALRHSSFVNEQDDDSLPNNERLEFLGDAVLNLVVGHLLMERYPDLQEGDLSRMRASLVNEGQLAGIARTLALGDHMRFGRGEIQTDGKEKNSILADAMEAVIAAVYLDGGFNAAFEFIHTHFSALITATVAADNRMDYKSQLQELVQSSHQQMPQYDIIDESGPDHAKSFVAKLRVCDIITLGKGSSKKMAEQKAARKALARLQAK